MKCPFCASVLNKVVDKRAVRGTGEIRRRRECLKCGRRFTTYEKISSFELVVIKKDGRREPFLRAKLQGGIEKALEKRPVGIKVGEITDKIERRLRKKGSVEVQSRLIGQMVLGELKRIDSVAYLRFASVYRRFDGAEDFVKELTTLASLKS